MKHETTLDACEAYPDAKAAYDAKNNQSNRQINKLIEILEGKKWILLI
jgi:hypothetical protein